MLESQPGDVSTTYADITKAKDMLGYQPKAKMEEGIRRFVEWYKRAKNNSFPLDKLFGLWFELAVY